MSKKGEAEETGSIELDTKTQDVIKFLFDDSEKQIQQIKMRLQEQLNLLITGYVNAKGQEGIYVVSKDFTKLEKQLEKKII